MEEKKNSTKTLIIVIAVLVAIIVCGVVGFIVYNNTKSKENEISSEENNTSTSESKDSSESDNNSSKDAKESSIENPLKLNEWGLASKRVSKYLSESYADKEYVDVPVRVTKVTRGDEATTIVKNWFDNQRLYKYEDPKATTEWTVIDYEIDLSKLTFDEGTIGTTIDINSSVKGLTGNSVKYNDITYILTTKDISNRDYVKEPGIYKGQFVVTLPQGCTEYLVNLGDDYDGTSAFFRCE